MDQNRPLHYLHEGDVLPEGLSRDRPNLRQQMLEKGLLAGGSDGRLAVRFVGVAVTDDVTFVMLPKVRLNADNNTVQRQILRALRTYARWTPSHHEPSPHLNPDPARGEVSGIAIFEWLMDDFVEYGLYRKTEIDDVINGAGATNWGSTIGNMAPIFSGGRPIYVDTLRRRTENDGSNFATKLHLHLLEMLSSKYAAILDYEPIILDHEPVERFGILPDAVECRARIMDEMRQVFSDRSSQLLSMMISAVETLEMETSRGLALYGTSSFHNVWEAACSRVCGNEVEFWAPSLPAPVWTSIGGSRSRADTFRPDAVTPLDDMTLLIADAKYYRPSLNPVLRGVPGVNDVAKQVWYKQYLTGPAQDRGYEKIENIFLFPGADAAISEPLLQHVGVVEFPIAIEKVEAIKVDFLKAMKAYSDRSDRLQQTFRRELAGLLSATSALVENDFPL